MNNRIVLRMGERSRRMRFPLLLLCLLLTALGAVQAQPGGDGPTTGSDIKKILGQSDPSKEFSSLTDREVLPVERRVNPDVYHVGPNDQLLISAQGLTDPIPSFVGVDNILTLPRGMKPLDVSGMTLTEVRITVDSIFRARSAGYGEVRISLLAPRLIYVTVSGNVINSDRFVVTSADRVTTAIDLANRIPEELAIADEQLLEMSKDEILGNKSQYGSRNLGSESKKQIRRVVIRHADGTSSEADLIRYKAFGDDTDNPTLREGDNVIVGYTDPFGPTVSAVGAVNNPVTSLPFREGDNLALLMKMAAGVRDDSQLGAAYIVRVTEAGEAEIPVDVTSNGAMEAFPLVAGDQLIVPSQPRAQAVRSGVVTLEGEVVRPQAYSIVPGKTTLSQLIDRAGGFTPFASLNGAYIRRPDDPLSLRPSQLVLDPKAGIATSTLSLEDTTRFKYDQQLQQNMVSADFEAIFKGGDLSKDVILQSGDEVIVPRDFGQVYVSGRVKHPGWVAYSSGKDYEYYVAQAGGFTAAAAPDRVAIEKFGTGIWDGPESEIASGDKIYVPGERDTPARTVLEQTSTVLLIVSSALGIIQAVLSIVQFFENK